MKRIQVTPANQEKVLEEAITVLQAGGLVVYPTETTYGIGADCENSEAVHKLLSYKGKRDGKALSIAVADRNTAKRYVKLNDTAQSVYTNFLPGPVTVISKSTGIAAAGIASERDTIGIRIPDYPLALSLLKKFGKGITATGANASYKKRPYSIEDILDNISDKQGQFLDLILDVGELPHNAPSTVIDTTFDDLSVVRAGTIAFGSYYEKKSSSVEETIALGQHLVSEYRSYLTYTPVIFALTGSMGAGKTHFVKGIAKGLRISEPITSPTYTFAHEYTYTNEGKVGTFSHIDTWRMNSQQDLEDLGFLSMIGNNHTLCIEWANRFQDYINSHKERAKIIWISIEQGDTEDERILTFSL